MAFGDKKKNVFLPSICGVRHIAAKDMDITMHYQDTMGDCHISHVYSSFGGPNANLWTSSSLCYSLFWPTCFRSEQVYPLCNRNLTGVPTPHFQSNLGLKDGVAVPSPWYSLPRWSTNADLCSWLGHLSFQWPISLQSVQWFFLKRVPFLCLLSSFFTLHLNSRILPFGKLPS